MFLTLFYFLQMEHPSQVQVATKVQLSKLTLSFSLHQEPIGSTKPKFASKLDLQAFKEVAGSPMALTCPAQGSPVPAFRY